MNDVMTINTTALANKDLRKHLNEIKKAVETIGANRWKVADALRKISDNAEYKEDFKTDTALAEALGMKRQNFQKLVKASKYHAECKDVDEDGNVTLLLDGFSVSAVFEIIVIPIDDVPTFFDCMNGTEFAVTKESTCKAVRESVQTYKAWTEESEESVESAESAESAESVESAESSESDTATAEKRDDEFVDAITSITDFLNHASREEVLEVKDFIEKHY